MNLQHILFIFLNVIEVQLIYNVLISSVQQNACYTHTHTRARTHTHTHARTHIHTDLYLTSDSTYKWYNMVFVFFWHILLSMILSRSIHVAANVTISFFLCGGCWVVFHCMYVSCLLYPFIYQWTFTLLPCLGYSE